MNPDRELLELAAKAMGDDVVQFRGHYLHDRDQYYFRWNPLTDDGDALRLAVKLQIDVKQYGDRVAAWFEGGFIGTGFIPYYDDPNAATRRAIVLAAAEIGKTLSS